MELSERTKSCPISCHCFSGPAFTCAVVLPVEIPSRAAGTAGLPLATERPSKRHAISITGTRIFAIISHPPRRILFALQSPAFNRLADERFLAGREMHV